MKLLPAIELETTSSPDSAVIWLHGLGADGNDFAPIVPELGIGDDLGIRFIFPHAPSIPVTINGGFVMPAWYDITDMKIDRKVDFAQLHLSAEAINGHVESQIERGIDSRRIIIAGFSQGGAIAYQVALSYRKSLGGLLAMSSYLATYETIDLHEANRALPITIHHGSHDPVVPEVLGKKAFDFLKNKGYAVSYRTYPMEHSVCPQQISDISSWIKSVLK